MYSTPKQEFITFEYKGQILRLLPEDKHPFDDPTYPCFRNPKYSNLQKEADVVFDCIEGKKQWIKDGKIINPEKAQVYCPQDRLEDMSDYQKRLQRTNFPGFTTQAYEEFPSLIATLNVSEDLNESFKEYLEDVDLAGNNLQQFFFDADKLVMRDGLCGIIVEYPSKEDIELKGVDRPYLCTVERVDIYNWLVGKYEGAKQLIAVTIREYHTNAIGIYGEIKVPFYRTYFADGSSTLEAILYSDVDSKGVPVTLETTQNSIGKQPFVVYSWDKNLDLEITPTLYHVAEATLDYYHLYQEYRQAIYKLNIPVPVRKGLVTPGLDPSKQDLPPVYVGPNTAIDVPENGDFFFATPDRDCLDTDRIELDKLALEAQRRSLKFLENAKPVEKTATEVKTDLKRAQATVNFLIVSKESTLENVLALWCDYYKEEPTGAIEVSKEFLTHALTAQEVETLSNLAVRNQLTLGTLLEILKNGRWFSPKFDIEGELEALDKLERVFEGMPTKASYNETRLNPNITQEDRTNDAIRETNSSDQE